MKGLIVALLIMGLLYLLLLRDQTRQMDVISAPSIDAEVSEGPATQGAKNVQPLAPYQRELDKAKGVEAMLDQAAEDRMRSIDGLERGE